MIMRSDAESSARAIGHGVVCVATGPFIDVMTTNEAELAEKLGVPRATLKDLRKDMTPGKHWTKEKSRIVYTPEGIEVLEKAMGLREVPEGFYFEDKEYKEVTVKRSGFLNRKVVLVWMQMVKSYWSVWTIATIGLF